MIDEKNRYVIENYGKKPGFSSFLPGISGMYGVPIWCYYVNRGQCITSFGVQDKDHSIMEFYPALQAYALTKKMGFRTFVREKDKVTEPFRDEKKKHTMSIGMNELKLWEHDPASGLDTTVAYTTLPGEKVGALIRRVTIKNISGERKRLEILDGMPAVIPYGIDLKSMKNMGQTIKAWMEVRCHETGIPFFKVRSSTADSAQVTEVKGGNYGLAMDGQGERLPVIVDAEQIFAYDLSFDHPVRLEEGSLAQICSSRQATQNQVPCCFFAREAQVDPGKEIVLYELYGQARDHDILEEFSGKITGPAYFEQKMAEAVELTDRITDRIATSTGSAVFDGYCRQTFLDNVLRGGYPVILGENKLFYLYSRKHGDIERDYNYFSMLPEFFSQGNGNFRDVNQNRRCDVQFAPYVEDKNLKTFYNCIQINGYNPLGIEKITYRAHVEGLGDVFTPGELYQYLEKTTDSDEELERRFSQIITEAEYEDRTSFIEGYWTDHWTYNLDLLESYLTVYPEREHYLLYEDGSYTYLQSHEEILPRAQRYEKTENGIRQYHFLRKNPRADRTYLTDAAGRPVKSNLMEKLFLLCVVKTAALDAYGMGVEMEGGKPGWYDALNGLPGLLGSSMCETYEVARTLAFTIGELEKYREDICVLQEVTELARELGAIIAQEQPEKSQGAVYAYWNRAGDAKESYWKRTEEQVGGAKTVLSWQEAAGLLRQMQTVVLHGIDKALKCGQGISPAYFYYNVTEFREDASGIHPTQLEQQMLPYYLEGPVRHLKLNMTTEKKRELYQRVKNSQLYDGVLQMYKVDAPLTNTSFEVGRCRAFTPGWLENESIWLHMEYKYLLELLKSGLYEEFMEDFHRAAIPFLDGDTYGRSLLENSSFIASCANPNPAVWGKGFVARLSGSTAEFLQMWQIMMFGARPFAEKHGVLTLTFTPLFPDYLIGEDRKIEAMFLGSTRVTYLLCDRDSFVPGNYAVQSCVVTFADGTAVTAGEHITGEPARRIRAGEAGAVQVYLVRKQG